MGKKKRKVLEDYSANAKLEEAITSGRSACGTIEKMFRAKVFVEESAAGGEPVPLAGTETGDFSRPAHCVAMVLPNELCVLFLPDWVGGEMKACRLHASQHNASSELSGKKKKGAPTLTPDMPICTIELVSGVSMNILSPLRGKLLEVNPALMSGIVASPDGEGNGEKGHDRAYEPGYIAVVSPFNDVPAVGTDLARAAELRHACHSWLSHGSCTRGDACIFTHVPRTNESVSCAGTTSINGVTDRGIAVCDDHPPSKREKMQ